jgi:hypothetical protein
MADEVQCPHCNTLMVPSVVERGRSAGKPKCTACGRGFESTDAAPAADTPSPVVEEPQAPVETSEPRNFDIGVKQMAKNTKTDVQNTPDETMPEQTVREAEVPPPPTVDVKTVERPVDRELNEKWRWLKARVKRTGGFIKNLGDDDRDKAEAMLKELNWPVEKGWPNDVFIPGYDNASHETNQRALFEKPIKMVTVDK